MKAETENALDRELAELQAAAAAFSTHFIPDAHVRAQYIEQAKRFSLELQRKVETNQLTSQAAAKEAQSMRNMILEAQRGKSTALGLSIAEFLKKEGKTLAELEVKYATESFGREFSKLSDNQKSSVWKTIVQKSGQTRASASDGAR